METYDSKNLDIVKQIVWAKNKITMTIPEQGISNLVHMGIGELSDLLSFGFSYIEQEDHCVSYVLVSPGLAKRVVQEIEDFYFTADTTPYIGILWTAQMIVTDRVGDFNIIFSNEDQSVVLALNLNKIMEE
jgi:hypothetical protein